MPSAIVYRPLDRDRQFMEPTLRPPAWIQDRDTLWFQLAIPDARIPGESKYIGLFASNPVPVEVNDNVGASLPEFCLVLPTGEVVDFVQYDDNIPLPAEVPQDEYACISALLAVQFEEPPPKRQRAGGP